MMLLRPFKKSDLMFFNDPVIKSDFFKDTIDDGVDHPRTTVTWNGQPIAIFGATHNFESNVSILWSVMGQVKGKGLSLTRMAKRCIRSLKNNYLPSKVLMYVDPKFPENQRWGETLGFTTNGNMDKGLLEMEMQ